MFDLSEEHVLLRDAAKAFVTDRMPTTHLRALRDRKEEAGFDRALWDEIAAMGWPGVLIPEAHGGAGLGYVGMGLILEEMGRTLAPSPLLSTGLIGAAALLLGGSGPQQAAWLPKIAAGEALFALAIDDGPHHHPEALRLKAEPVGAGFRLSGEKRYVADGHVAHVLIVAAEAPDGPALFLVPADAPGLTRRTLTTIDSRGAADLFFQGVETAERLHGGRELLDALLDRARIGLAAEMLGQAQQAFETTADYLRTRVQFGQTIGTFQALQHRAAKMLVELELTRTAVMAALFALDENRNDAAALASFAKARAGETLHLVTNEMVQLHGGIGMTDAHDAGLYLKRARVAEALYGSASYHRSRYAALSGY